MLHKLHKAQGGSRLGHKIGEAQQFNQLCKSWIFTDSNPATCLYSLLNPHASRSFNQLIYSIYKTLACVSEFNYTVQLLALDYIKCI